MAGSVNMAYAQVASSLVAWVSRPPWVNLAFYVCWRQYDKLVWDVFFLLELRLFLQL